MKRLLPLAAVVVGIIAGSLYGAGPATKPAAPTTSSQPATKASDNEIKVGMTEEEFNTILPEGNSAREINNEKHQIKIYTFRINQKINQKPVQIDYRVELEKGKVTSVEKEIIHPEPKPPRQTNPRPPR